MNLIFWSCDLIKISKIIKKRLKYTVYFANIFYEIYIELIEV